MDDDDEKTVRPEKKYRRKNLRPSIDWDVISSSRLLLLASLVEVRSESHGGTRII